MGSTSLYSISLNMRTITHLHFSLSSATSELLLLSCEFKKKWVVAVTRVDQTQAGSSHPLPKHGTVLVVEHSCPHGWMGVSTDLTHPPVVNTQHSKEKSGGGDVSGVME